MKLLRVTLYSIIISSFANASDTKISTMSNFKSNFARQWTFNCKDQSKTLVSNNNFGKKITFIIFYGLNYLETVNHDLIMWGLEQSKSKPLNFDCRGGGAHQNDPTFIETPSRNTIYLGSIYTKLFNQTEKVKSFAKDEAYNNLLHLFMHAMKLENSEKENHLTDINMETDIINSCTAQIYPTPPGVHIFDDKSFLLNSKKACITCSNAKVIDSKIVVGPEFYKPSFFSKFCDKIEEKTEKGMDSKEWAKTLNRTHWAVTK